MAEDTPPLLQVNDLKVHFTKRKSLFGNTKEVVHAVDGISFSVAKGSTFGIVGESGSGKTTAALSIMRLAPVTSGTIMLDNTPIHALDGLELRKTRRRFQMVFQDPYSSLNPRFRVGKIIREPLDLMEIGAANERDDMVAELFKQVGLRPEQMMLFPHQFSGGQRQRIGLARALATKPDLVVCDEPVSALDVAIQAQILNLMCKLQSDLNLTFLFISHDLGVVQHICDEIIVMYLGQVVEQGDRITLFTKPKHPYTRALLSAVPSAKVGHERENRVRLSGDPPSPINLPKGCRFAERCPFKVEECHNNPPSLRTMNDGSRIACHRVDDLGNSTYD